VNALTRSKRQRAPVLERLQARELAVEHGADRQLATRRVDARKAEVVAPAVAGEQPRAVLSRPAL
jgi:hypothetical protein